MRAVFDINSRVNVIYIYICTDEFVNICTDTIVYSSRRIIAEALFITLSNCLFQRDCNYINF